eukprot:Cvel_26769.t1-p1 / transcript=Cvel_26769.t1 / gene=Cvel_26769 / organism=Chromera_velia_CCMP2878 / gene_product=hypothetical protein / transcript_product=hypothetical protein / location=Cvel_scaffold3237:261-1542(-) / protein_length=244 / sequence_SO=supercontig / SO=protein_coding / is_pseudo=false
MVKWLSPALLFALYQCSLGAPPDSTTAPATASQAQPPAPVPPPPEAKEAETDTETPMPTPMHEQQVEPMEEEFDEDDYPYSLEAYGDDDYEGTDNDDYFEDADEDDEGARPIFLEDGKVLVPRMTWEVVDTTEGNTDAPEAPAGTSAENRKLQGYDRRGRYRRPRSNVRGWPPRGRRLGSDDSAGMTEKQDNEHPEQMDNEAENRKLQGYDRRGRYRRPRSNVRGWPPRGRRLGFLADRSDDGA